MWWWRTGHWTAYEWESIAQIIGDHIAQHS